MSTILQSKGRIFAFILLFLFNSCGTQKYHNLAESNRCEEALTHIPKVRKKTAIERRGKQLVGHLISYPATGIGYALDLLIVLSGPVLVGLVACSPIIAAEVILEGHGHATSQCFQSLNYDFFNPNEQNPNFGGDIYQNTNSMRCPDFSDFTEYIRSVSQCFLDRGKPQDLRQAKKQLILIQENKKIYKCLPDQERQNIANLLTEINKKIKTPQL